MYCHRSRLCQIVATAKLRMFMKTCWSVQTRWLFTAVSVTAILFSTSLAVRAQKGSVPTRDLSSSERELGGLESEANRAKRDSKVVMAEINEDFGRLRLINDEFKAATSPSQPLNYKAIFDDAVEIKKRGNRLKINLAGLPKPEKQDKVKKESAPTDEAQMRSLLSTENTVLTAFLNNPVFSDIGTLDNQLAIKARRDLEAVIELSDIVKNGAEKLSKSK